MKRALLIAGGTVGGLGAVLAITPPQLSATKSTNALSGTLTQGTSVAAGVGVVGADADALVFVPGLITVLFLVAAVDGRD